MTTTTTGRDAGEGAATVADESAKTTTTIEETDGHDDGDSSTDPAGDAFAKLDAGELEETPSSRSSSRRQRGKCTWRDPETGRKCGRNAYSRDASKCEEHRGLRADRKPSPRSSSPRTPRLETELRTQLEFAASIWGIRDPVCAQALAMQAAPIAKFWADRAKSNAAVAKVLDGLVSSGGWLGGLSVHAPLILAIWAHHVQPQLDARRAGELEETDQPAPDASTVFGANGEPAPPWGQPPTGLLTDQPADVDGAGPVAI